LNKVKAKLFPKLLFFIIKALTNFCSY
jgi:hypothetical protein